MDVLFYLARGGQPITIRLVNKALKTYQARKHCVHRDIRSWVDHSESTFDHLNAKRCVDEMERIINANCIKPEERLNVQGEHQADENWVTREELTSVAQ